MSAFLKLRDGGPAFLLESVEHGRLGRHSMIGVRPQAVIRGAEGELVLTGADGSRRALDAADPFGAVEDVVQAVGMAPPPPSLVFAGGAVGYFGYDLVRTVERLPDQPPDDLGVPDLIALITGPVVVFDHLDRSLTIVVPCDLDPEGDVEAAYGGARGDGHPAQGPAGGPGAAPRALGGGPGPRAGHQQRLPGALRGLGRARPRVHLRRRRLPDRPVAALLGARSASTPSRSTAACARSTRRPTCTSSRPTRSRWSARRPSCW